MHVILILMAILFTFFDARAESLYLMTNNVKYRRVSLLFRVFILVLVVLSFPFCARDSF